MDQKPMAPVPRASELGHGVRRCSQIFFVTCSVYDLVVFQEQLGIAKWKIPNSLHLLNLSLPFSMSTVRVPISQRPSHPASKLAQCSDGGTGGRR